MAARLAAVPAADPPAEDSAMEPDPSSPDSLLTAAQQSQRALLIAMRDHLARRLDEGVPARDLASLSKRLLDVTAELRELEAVQPAGPDPVAAGAAAADESYTPPGS